MRSLVTNNRGVALLTTLLVLVFMVIITLDFGNVIRRNLTGAAYSMTRIDLRERVRSAVNLALAILDADQQTSRYDSLHEHWADGEWLQQRAGKLFDDGTLELAIDDHSGRLQINALLGPQGGFDPEQKNRFLRLLTADEIGLSTDGAEHLLDALKDWLDADDEITGFGAENSWYHALPTPYDCRNGPVTSIDELLLVRGMSKELLYGAGNHLGLAEFLTPYGNDGWVNINTASPLVLHSLGERLDHATVEALLQYRADSAHDLAVLDWYKNVYGDLNIAKTTVSSTYFGVRVKASLRNIGLQAAAMVYRPQPQSSPPSNAPPPTIVSWQAE